MPSLAALALRPRPLVVALALMATCPSLFANDISLYTPVFSQLDPIAGNTVTSSGNIGTGNREINPLAVKHQDIWNRIRSGFAIPDLKSPTVDNQMAFFGQKPAYFERTSERASPYLYHVVEELEKRDMPTELALLPFIESSFNPAAVSSAKAAGMWQFIPSTGRTYNLKQNLFTDERRDVLASTDAALNYLQELYGMFGDWQLALAAYNWGENAVQRAIDRNLAAGKPTDFATLSEQMPAETRNYVPKLQAVKNIIAHPGEYGVSLPDIDNQPYFVTIGRMKDIDVKVAAQLAELSVDEFKALNPQYNRPVIVGGEDTKILLPQKNAEIFKSNLSTWTEKLSNWTAHTVMAAREKIETIAAQFGTTPSVLREVNHIPPKMQLLVGSTILVPKTGDEHGDISAEIADNATINMVAERPPAPARRAFAVAGNGDTLSGIAHKNGVSVSDLQKWNHLKGNSVRKGQQIALSAPNVSAAAGGRSSRGDHVMGLTKSSGKTGSRALSGAANDKKGHKIAATGKKAITIASKKH